MKNETVGYIYILTNPSFPQYVKIGYADDVNQRLEQLNRSECIPFAFRLYAYYKVPSRLTDLKLHSLIDKLNPNLRSIEEFNGKKRVREFYAMEADEAYSILETIAEINGLQENLVLVNPTDKEKEDENQAKEIRELSFNRHHFKNIKFYSSLTNKSYEGKTRADGTLCIVEVDTGVEVPNNANPSKKSIIGQAIVDLGGTTTKDETLYQRYRKLSKMIV
ncbi:MAG: GIY-YIG nuclease family protein [Anaeroplasmataceae bacterium]|nr:GIY-YIG nuclease family protein [Anaeroplasmataceae bacterium]